MVARQTVMSVAERVIAADPTQVWALVADPGRIPDWAGVRLVGYMGTELPQVGQSIFIRSRLWRAEPRRVEIESWDAGAGNKCLVHGGDEPIGFELTIHPEVGTRRIDTTVRLVQRSPVAAFLQASARGWVDRQLLRKLDRIEKAVSP